MLSGPSLFRRTSAHRRVAPEEEDEEDDEMQSETIDTPINELSITGSVFAAPLVMRAGSGGSRAGHLSGYSFEIPVAGYRGAHLGALEKIPSRMQMSRSKRAPSV